jgi:hypothetical protein
MRDDRTIDEFLFILFGDIGCFIHQIQRTCSSGGGRATWGVAGFLLFLHTAAFFATFNLIRTRGWLTRNLCKAGTMQNAPPNAVLAKP